MKNNIKNIVCRLAACSLIFGLNLAFLPSHVSAQDKATEKQASQQPVTIKGFVSDKNGEPLIGVAVTIVGTNQGTSTDLSGHYTLTVPNQNIQLEFSFIGFESAIMVPGIRSTLDVVLKEDVKTLDEVVVVGYGTMKKSDLVGAVIS